MPRRNRFLAAIVAASLWMAATPALAFDDPGLEAKQKSTPVLLDAMVLRPVGLAITAVGAVAFVIPGAITLATRPTDVAKPFEAMVAKPFRYTFIDPLGSH